MEQAKYYRAKRKDLDRAIQGFGRVMESDFAAMDDFEQDVYKNAAVQKFEYCIELYWKVGKLFLSLAEGADEVTPKGVIKALYRLTELEQRNYEALLKMIEHRNLLSHLYSIDRFEEICSHLQAHANTLNTILQHLPADIDSENENG